MESFTVRIIGAQTTIGPPLVIEEAEKEPTDEAGIRQASNAEANKVSTSDATIPGKRNTHNNRESTPKIKPDIPSLIDVANTIKEKADVKSSVQTRECESS